MDELTKKPIDSLSPNEIETLQLAIEGLPKDTRDKLAAKLNELKKDKENHDKVRSKFKIVKGIRIPIPYPNLPSTLPLAFIFSFHVAKVQHFADQLLNKYKIQISIFSAQQGRC